MNQLAPYSRWRGAWVLWSMVIVTATAAGCAGERVQSALHPAGPAAKSVADLWWLLFLVLGVYSLAVFVLTLLAIFRRAPVKPTDRNSGRVFILMGGVVLPAVILVPLLVFSVSTTAALRNRDAALTIRVVGHRWWWEVEYPDHRIITANELIIPAGEPVKLELTSADVIHSFWVPQLHGKMDMLPGQTTEFWTQADSPGIYRGQCAEYCGLQHAHMGFVVKALSPERFVDWLSNPRVADPRFQDLPTTPTQSSHPQHERGERLFTQHGCHVCHAVDGTQSKGRVGPDLALLAQRETLAAGTLPNSLDNLIAWLADPQSIKPGANMPPTETTPENLREIAIYLLSLPRAPIGNIPGDVDE